MSAPCNANIWRGCDDGDSTIDLTTIHLTTIDLTSRAAAPRGPGTYAQGKTITNEASKGSNHCNTCQS